MDTQLEWNDKSIIRMVNDLAEEAEEETAEEVLKDAQNILMSKAKKPTGKLKSEIEIKKSKFKDGGYLIEAQGPGNYDRYYASFVELGTHKMTAKPFLRPAKSNNQNKLKQIMEQKIRQKL